MSTTPIRIHLMDDFVRTFSRFGVINECANVELVLPLPTIRQNASAVERQSRFLNLALSKASPKQNANAVTAQDITHTIDAIKSPLLSELANTTNEIVNKSMPERLNDSAKTRDSISTDSRHIENDERQSIPVLECLIESEIAFDAQFESNMALRFFDSKTWLAVQLKRLVAISNPFGCPA